MSLGLLASALPMVVAAQSTIATAPPDVMTVQSLDEVVVSGNRDSLSRARRAMQAAEDRFYERLNALNEDHRDDIVCRIETPTGTRISFRRCEPRSLEESMREESQRVFGGQAGDATRLASVSSAEILRIAAANDAKRRALALVEKDVGLRRALLEHARLTQHYQELRQRKMKGRLAVWD